MKCLALYESQPGGPSPHKCLFGLIFYDIIDLHHLAWRFGTSIYWASDHYHLGVSGFNPIAPAPVVKRDGRSTCAGIPCAAELKLGN